MASVEGMINIMLYGVDCNLGEDSKYIKQLQLQLQIVKILRFDPKMQIGVWPPSPCLMQTKKKESEYPNKLLYI